MRSLRLCSVNRSLSLTSLLFLGLACTDAGEEPLAQAEADYRVLVRQAKLPTDPSFDGVLATLKTVPEGSKHKKRADDLIRAIETARAPRVQIPLARAQPTSPVPAARSTQETCAKLAAEMGTAPEHERAARMKALDDCRKKADHEDHEGAPHQAHPEGEAQHP